MPRRSARHCVLSDYFWRLFIQHIVEYAENHHPLRPRAVNFALVQVLTLTSNCIASFQSFPFLPALEVRDVNPLRKWRPWHKRVLQCHATCEHWRKWKP